MYEAEHLEMCWEDSISEVAAEDDAYWNDLYAEDDDEYEDD